MKQQIISEKFSLILPWSVHLLTSLGGILSLWGLHAVSVQNFSLVLKILILTIIVDAIDGPLARLLNVKEKIPSFDGALLDYIVDFTSWVVLPAFCLLKSHYFNQSMRVLLSSLIILSSCYQFCCKDLKNINNNFKRWPSAWSLAIICLFIWPISSTLAISCIFLFVFLSFVPIYYIHPLRLDSNYSKSKGFNLIISYLFIFFTALFILSLIISVWIYPKISDHLYYFQLICIFTHFILSCIQTLLVLLRKQ